MDLESVKSISHMEAAAEQIDAAIELFFSHRLLASITLAAAAERVLSDLLKSAGKSTSAETLKTTLENVLINEVEPKNIHKWRHQVYDWLRHADKHPQATQEVIPLEALAWIMCGIASFLKMNGVMTGQMKKFGRFWQENVTSSTEWSTETSA